MLARTIKWISAIAAGLALIDGVFGGGERLWAIANYIYPPRPDPSYELKVLDLGYMPDKFEKTGKRSFGIGLALYNTNQFPIYYEVETEDYSIDDFQNVSPVDLPKGRVLPKKMEPVEFSPINMGFKEARTYDGEAKVTIKYGKNRQRLGNELMVHAKLHYSPKADKDHQFSYALYPDSVEDVRSTMPEAWSSN